MKIKIIALTAALAVMASLTASAQNRLESGGLQASQDNVAIPDLFEWSQTQFNFGTARSMSMAGAFTSLGADMSSMSINPAGLGMYRSGAFSITPLVTMANSQNSAEAYEGNAKNRFSLGNFGAVFNVYEGTRGLVSFNIGLGYNRLADLNYTSSFRSNGNIGSIADMYSKQLDYAGINSNSIRGDNLNWNNTSSSLWPAVLGFKVGMTDDPTNMGAWSPTWISGDRDRTYIDQYSTVQSRGSIGEYDISVGANINNKFYIGATLGIQTIYQKKEYFYQEEYNYDQPGGVAPDLDYQLMYSKMNQAVFVEGTGVNFKLGVTYRPIENLRIGLAFHTPTYIGFDRRYQAAAASKTHANRDVDPSVDPDPNGNLFLDAESPILADDGSNSWSFTTPARMLAGVSYMFGQRGLISVDYERAWYNGMRVKDAPQGVAPMSFNNDMQTLFKGSNTVRVGAEFKLLPTIALRAGFGYSGSWLKDDQVQFPSGPVATEIMYYGAGLGFALSRSVELDLAYSYQHNKQSAYALYFADEFQDGTFVQSNASDTFTTDLRRHALAATLTFRF